MHKSIPGFTTDTKPAKIDANGTVPKPVTSQPPVSGKGGKGGMPDSGVKPAKV